MSVLLNAVRELAWLFVDDAWLALAILVVVAFAAIVSTLVSDPLLTGGILLLGSLGVLMANVATTARR